MDIEKLWYVCSSMEFEFVHPRIQLCNQWWRLPSYRLMQHVWIKMIVSITLSPSLHQSVQKRHNVPKSYSLDRPSILEGFQIRLQPTQLFPALSDILCWRAWPLSTPPAAPPPLDNNEHKDERFDELDLSFISELASSREQSLVYIQKSSCSSPQEFPFCKCFVLMF